jgi:hypothetical protein
MTIPYFNCAFDLVDEILIGFIGSRVLACRLFDEPFGSLQINEKSLYNDLPLHTQVVRSRTIKLMNKVFY